ncbi:B3 domain-containing protein Os01g0234100 [Helianthus annuus]|uniref:B3 domain-containing protein Os01g0234100 n=1 Tax=Helianthus annuus TaxID=4232 RepID=UPI000B8F0212|nr:B3 domain-containing protein Os01g0234100 [Helianthus annuus]
MPVRAVEALIMEERSRGMPKLSWDESVRQDMIALRLSKYMVQDRILCRRIMKVLSDAPGPSSSLQKRKSLTKSSKAQVLSSPAMSRAKEIQSSLGNEFPSCIKVMLSSQVTSGFCTVMPLSLQLLANNLQGLPAHFCKSFLSKEDVIFVLEDESGKKSEVKYIAQRHILSAGWNNFAVTHKLEQGDVLLFHLVEKTKFKVYILKDDYSNEADVAVSLLNLEAHSEHVTPATPTHKTKKNKHPESLQNKVKRPRKSPTLSISEPPSGHHIEHLGNSSQEVQECSRPSKLRLSFEEVKCFEDFRILVNGNSIDHELTDDERMDYYKLCLYKNEFLHPEAVYEKFAAGLIGQTLMIANEIKTSNLTTSKEEFEKWDGYLKSLEGFDMKVDFLRDMIRTLVRLVFESKGAPDIKQYAEASNKYKLVKDKLKILSEKRKELEERAKEIEGISGMLKAKIEKYEQKLKEEVDVPW